MKFLTRWVRRSMFTFLHKSFNVLVIFAFMLQPFGATGFNVRVLASDGDTAVVEPTVVAPAETPAPKIETVTPLVEEKVVTPPKEAVVPAETPVVTPKVEVIAPIETPVVAPVVTPTKTAVTSQENTPAADTTPVTPTDTTTITTLTDTTTPPSETITPAKATSEVPVVVPVIPVETWGATVGNKATTNSSVELGKVYVAPQNNQVTVTFTKLPEKVGTLSVEEITLTPEQVKTLGALSNKAYDITSDMVDGTFAYDLTLPKTADQKNVEIKFAENVAGLNKNVETVPDSAVKTETVSVSASLDHFTIFVVTKLANDPVCVTNTGYCYQTIQAAITASESLGGDNNTINVAAGTYSENLTINQNLTLTGAGSGNNPVSDTIINGGIDANGANVIIKDLQITNQNS